MIKNIYFEQPNDNGSSPDAKDTETSNTGKDIKTLDEALDALSKTREEAAKYRKRSSDFEKISKERDELATFKTKFDKMFGEDDDPQEKLSALEQENRKLKFERTLSSVSRKHNADDELLSAYLSHKGLLKDVDPNDTEKISSIVQETVKSNPRLLLEPPKNFGDPKPEGGDPSKKKTMNDFIRGFSRR